VVALREPAKGHAPPVHRSLDQARDDYYIGGDPSTSTSTSLCLLDKKHFNRILTFIGANLIIIMIMIRRNNYE
jgi:hypothetical protein